MPSSKLEAGPSSLRVRVDGVELAVRRSGHGPTIVCLHAVGHDAEDYADFTRRYADRYEIIAVDWPGHGQSGRDREPCSAARYGQLLIALLDQLSVRDPLVIGNSIGGAAAIHYAEQRPVRALVLCDAGGLVPVDAKVRLFCRLMAAFFAAGARGARWFSWAYDAYYRYVVLPMPAASARRAQIVAQGASRAALLRDAWRSFARPEADVRHVLESLRVPLWFAWANRDRVIPYALCKPCIERCKMSRVTMFDAGHSAFLESPDAFAQHFSRFVEHELQAAA